MNTLFLQNESSSSSQCCELDIYDSMLSTYDLDEAVKRCVLADSFYLTHFKGFQLEVINAVLQKRDKLVIQPTGRGQSVFPVSSCVHQISNFSCDSNNKSYKCKTKPLN